MKRFILVGSLPFLVLAACDESQDFPAVTSASADGGGVDSAAAHPGADANAEAAAVDSGSKPAADSGVIAPAADSALPIEPTADAAAVDGAVGPSQADGGLCPTTEGTDGVILASGQPQGLFGLALDASNVYFSVVDGAGTVGMVPKAGGSTTVLASSQPGPFSIASDGTHVFWCNGGSTSIPETVMTVAVGGGTPSQFWSEGPFQGGAVFDVVTDGTNLYWPGNSDLQAEPVGGGAVAQLSDTGTPTFLSLYGGTLYYVASTGISSSIQSIPTSAAGSPTATPQMLWSLPSANSVVVGISADATGVYWVDQGMTVGTGSVEGIPSGASTPQALASSLSYAGSVASDGIDVYFTDSLGLRKVPVGGGAATIVAQGEVGAVNVKVDATSVYWINSCFGTVKKIPK